MHVPPDVNSERKTHFQSFILRLGSFSCVGVFPWFISDFLRFIPTWIKLAVLLPMFVLWISFPLVRSSATLMIGIYLSSFVIYRRVFKESVLGLGYDEKRFNLLLGIGTLMHWIAPFMVTAQHLAPLFLFVLRDNSVV